MEPNNSSAAAAPATETAAIPSFADQWAAANQPQSQPAQGGQPAQNEQPKPETKQPDANAATEWLKQFGEYTKPEELKAVLSKLPDLEKNQITAEQRASLRLLSEPEARREYLRLVDTDYTAMDDEAMLLQDFRDRNPTLSPEDAELVFQQEQDNRFPGLANEEGDPTRRAHLAMRKAAADEVRGRYNSTKETKLAEYQKGALASDAPSKEELQQKRDAHLDQVKTLVGKGADAFKMSVNVDGKPLNLAVEAADLPAIQQLMESPFAAFTNEDGTTNYDAVRDFAVMKTMLPKFLSLAQKAALEQQGASVPLDELHNGAGGAATSQNTTGTPSFMEQLAKHNGGAGKPALKY